MASRRSAGGAGIRDGAGLAYMWALARVHQFTEFLVR